MALVALDAAVPAESGWFAYAPLNEAAPPDPGFPWRYVVVPLALLLVDVVAVSGYQRRRRQP